MEGKHKFKFIIQSKIYFSLFRIIRTNSGNFREDNEHQMPSSFQRGGIRATTTGGKTSMKPLT